MKTGSYAAIVLAAGFSHRMQRFKPLLPLGKETITDYLMASFLQNGVEVYLVVGYQQAELRAGIRTENIHIVENPDFAKGMLTSVQAGVRSLGNAFKAAFIAPVDIPLVCATTIERFLIAAEDNPGKILFPVFRKARGHPPCIPAGLFPIILGWQGNGGLNSILHAHEDIAVEVSVPDSNILFDIDKPGDYEKLLKRSQAFRSPSEKVREKRPAPDKS